MGGAWFSGLCYLSDGLLRGIVAIGGHCLPLHVRIVNAARPMIDGSLTLVEGQDFYRCDG